MQFWTEVILPAFATFFVIIDPVGLTPIFVALTREQPHAEQQRVATRAVLLAAGILLLFAFFGEAIMRLFGITIPAFRIAGGLLLFLIALEMLFEKRGERRRRSASGRRSGQTEMRPLGEDDIWVFPLGIPLIAGPGAITSVILLMGQWRGDVTAQVAIVATMLVVLAMTWALFVIAGHARRFLSDTAVRAISRLLGIILSALAVQFVINGVAATLAGLPAR